MPSRDFIFCLIRSSLVCFIAGILPWVIGKVDEKLFYLRNKHKYYSRKISSSKSLLFLMVGVLFALVMSRYSVAYYSSFFSEGEIPCADIGRLEFGNKEFFNSFLHALQTFSMDEDYTEYWLNGQAMIRYVTDSDRTAEFFYNLYIGILNFSAPILGGAIVFEMLTKAFPTVRLWFSDFKIWKEKYYFSELNENSIALARSILSDRSRRYSTLVFTDAYADDEQEESTEWLLEAKSMGAICLKSDLLHISFNKCNIRGLHVFLIDKEENDNIGTLSKMLEDNNLRIYKKAHIYVFSSDGKYSHIDDEVSRIVDLKIGFMRTKLEEKNQNTTTQGEAVQNNNDKDKKDKIKLGLPHIIPVNIVRHTADTLMQSVPLFEPIADRKKNLPDNHVNQNLNVTIIGAGSIGTEMFLAAYRFGQILDTQLNINVVSLEDKEAFESKINYINPEILQTADENSNLLIWNCDFSEPKRSPAYMKYKYFQADAMSDEFETLFSDNPQLKDTDYFIVTLGNDEDNFTVADKIKIVIGNYHLYEKNDNKTVIAYSIYNSDLSRQLNRLEQRHYVHSSKDNDADIFMHAFGSKDEIYSCNNVFFEGIRESALLTGRNYKNKSPEQLRAHDENRENKKYGKINENEGNIYDIYNYKSDLARCMHIKYKIYSSGCCEDYVSIFSKDYNTDTRDSYNRELLEKYKDKVITKGMENEPLLHKLAWLEHRRWCAFMRSNGFRYVSINDMRKYYLIETFEHKKMDHKYLPLKLHPCLVECSTYGIFVALDVKGQAAQGYINGFDAKRLQEYKDGNLKDFDRLDELSYCMWYERKDLPDEKRIEEDYDFKKWDYPAEEKLAKLNS